VASSDATNIRCEAKLENGEWVINGEKHYITGVADPRCEIIIAMVVTEPESVGRHKRQSQILIPKNTPGVELVRPMLVFGQDDAPRGRIHLRFHDVRVPEKNIILGRGRGFEISLGRLGPGRIHHCMRAIGAAEYALELTCKRAQSRVAFGKKLSALGANYDHIANCRIDIETSRLLTLNAAHLMDTVGNKVAKSEIAQIKVHVPIVAQRVIDAAIQMHGGGGVSQDFPLASMYAHMRTLRLADGPDEVHHMVVGRAELQKYDLW
jgi:acyl-CoA dehydrogenase